MRITRSPFVKISTIRLLLADKEFKTPQRNRPEINMAKKSPEMIHGRTIVSMSSSRKAIFLFNFIVVFGRRRTSSSDVNPLEMLGPRWFSIHRFLPKSCLFQLLAFVCCFWSVIMSSSNLYFQSSRSPTLRSSFAHSTTAACSGRGTIESKLVYSPGLFYKTYLNRLVSLFYLSSPFQIEESWHVPKFLKCVPGMIWIHKRQLLTATKALLWM